MLDILPSRIRPLTLLATMLVAQVLMLAFQIRREKDVRLIRQWAVFVVTPFQRAGTYVFDGARGTWSTYVDLRQARDENEKLRGELAALKLRAGQLESRAGEAARLTTLLEFRDAHPEAEMLLARVIGASAGAGKTVYLNRGKKDGIEKNMPVITPDGVVGKIIDVYGETSQVLLLTDKESGVGALLANSRTQGVVRGPQDQENETEPHLHFVINDQQVEAGELILTSGQDRIFPKDLPVATVIEVKAGNPFKKIRVRPAARLDRLEELIVLKTRQELLPPQGQTVKAAGMSSNPPAAAPPAPVVPPKP
jgi:rod shape-determining protein MreC